jgi:hypothetical protein
VTVKILLANGKATVIDAQDAERVLRHKWHAKKNSHSRTFYAATNVQKVTLQLHRFILQLPPRIPQVDHRNCDGLDNRRCNLRIANDSQQRANTRLPSHNTSGFKGVFWVKRKRKYQASIKVNGRNIHLGYFKNKEEAAAAYDAAALHYFHEFARTNQMIPEYEGH